MTKDILVAFDATNGFTYIGKRNTSVPGRLEDYIIIPTGKLVEKTDSGETVHRTKKSYAEKARKEYSERMSLTSKSMTIEGMPGIAHDICEFSRARSRQRK